MKVWAIIIIALVFVSCSYQFDEPPFPKDELTPIMETEFGKELLSLLRAGGFPDLDTDDLDSLDENLTEDTMVYVISDDFLIQQAEGEGEDEGWELTVWTKNSHHIISCSLMQDESLISNNVDAYEKEEGSIYLKGQTAELKQLAIQLSLEASKLCIAFPYADASTVVDPSIEYKRQIDRLTTDLDIAHSTIRLSEEKVQDLENSNQQLEDGLSSWRTRFLVLLGVSGVIGLIIVLMAVRSRTKRTNWYR